MLGDEESNHSWPFEILKAIGKIVKMIAEKVWNYAEHY